MLREFIQAQEGAKAFPYRVELTDAGGPLYSGGAPMAYNAYNGVVAGGRIQTPLSQREAPRHMQTYGGSESIDWLMDAVGFTSTAGASAGWHFMDNGKVLVPHKDPKATADVQEAPFLLTQLFEEPNPFMSWSDLCEITLIDFLIVGNAYWVKWQTNAAGQPLALYRMAPEFVKIIPGPYGPEEYRYRLPGQRDEVTFTPDQVVHIKRPNPHSPYYGLGIVKGGARALDMEVALTNTMASYYEKQALPSGVVQTERRVPRDVFNKLKAQLRSFYAGNNNAGQLMVLEAGLKYTTVSPTAGDALFMEMGGWSRDRILAMFNLNKGLLGLWDGAGDPKLGDWQRLFDQKTMIPLMRKLSQVITRQLVKPAWGFDFVINYEETQQPDLILQRAQTLAPLPGIKVHEVRQAAGLPPSTGDEKIDNIVLNLPGQNLDATGQHGLADPNLTGEPGRPPIAKNTAGFGSVPPAQRKTTSLRNAAVVTTGKKSLEEIVEDLSLLEDELRGKAMRPANVTGPDEQLGTPPQDALVASRTREVDILVADLNRQLVSAATALERGLLDSAEGKAEGTVYQRIKASKAWQQFKDRLTQILEDGVQRAAAMANVQHSAQGLAPSDVDYESIAKGVVHRTSKGGLSEILDTLKSTILAKVLKAQRVGADRLDIESAIRSEIDNWRTGHANTVALTEATRGYNESTLEVALANGLNHVLVSDGEDFDMPCRKANGQRWTIAQARDNLLEHPNCRRAFVPVS